MIYGYARCSTRKEEGKQDISRQTRELEKQGATIIIEEHESGANENRSKLNALLEAVKPGDTIIATEVSRITRSTKQLCELVNFAKMNQLKLILGTFTVDCSNKTLDPVTEGILMMIGVFAQMERAIIVERVKSGMAHAAEQGKKIGRPKTSKDTIPAVFYKYYPDFVNGKLNKAEMSRLCELSFPTVTKYINMLKNSNGR